MPDPKTKLSPFAEEIRNYLERYPAASDTATGVARWWIQGPYVERTFDEVRGALEELAEAGLVLKKRNPNGEIQYAASERLRR